MPVPQILTMPPIITEHTPICNFTALQSTASKIQMNNCSFYPSHSTYVCLLKYFPGKDPIGSRTLRCIIMKAILGCCLALSAATAAARGAVRQQLPSKPHIVFALTDDLGESTCIYVYII